MGIIKVVVSCRGEFHDDDVPPQTRKPGKLSTVTGPGFSGVHAATSHQPPAPANNTIEKIMTAHCTNSSLHVAVMQ